MLHAPPGNKRLDDRKIPSQNS